MKTTTEAAGILGLMPRNIRHLCATGKLRATKIGRDWLIDEESLRRYQPRRKATVPS